MLAITETQNIYEKLCISESYKYLMGMKDMQDKKGVDGCGEERRACDGEAGHEQLGHTEVNVE